jgi:hypothetical protein
MTDRMRERGLKTLSAEFAHEIVEYEPQAATP